MSAPTYPDRLAIEPVDFPLTGTVDVPGSKSITNRALILAALSGQKVVLERALHSEDTHVMVDALHRLGVTVEQGDTEWAVHRPAGASFLPVEQADLFVANSGTSMRFLTAFVSLARGRFRLDGIPRMRERPIQDLLDALDQLGVRAVSETNNGCPPVIVDANGLDGGKVRIRGDVSSQFLSALLMAAPLASKDVTIEVEGELVSLPYVTMTIEMMRALPHRAGRVGRQLLLRRRRHHRRNDPRPRTQSHELARRRPLRRLPRPDGV
jgi:3-phosphoshikimate 1-carboxyvinyltransferase